MGGVAMTVVHVVGVIAVADRLMSATITVGVLMLGVAHMGVGLALVPVVVVGAVSVAVMEVVGVVAVDHGDVPAALAVGVVVIDVGVVGSRAHDRAPRDWSQTGWGITPSDEQISDL
jgi:hypothetical protein